MGALVGMIGGTTTGIAIGGTMGYGGGRVALKTLGDIGLTEHISNITDVEVALKVVTPSLIGACSGGVLGSIGGAAVGHAIAPPHPQELE